MLTICSKIVVPYDHSESSKKALKMAMNLAKQNEEIELNVVMVIQPQYPYGLPYAYAFSYEERVELGKSQFETSQHILDEVMEELQFLPNKTKTFLLEGSPAEVIVDFIKENDVDLVVMGSRGLSGVKEMFLGSVSHHVVQRATCPILIVK